VLTLAHLGAQVVVAGEAAEAGAETEAVAQRAGGHVRQIEASLDDEAALSGLAERVREAFGPVDAVLTLPPAPANAPFLTLTAVDWERGAAHGLRRAFLAAQAFLPAMLTRRQGTLLNIVCPQPQAGLTAFSAAQHGVTGLSQSLAAEVAAAGVRVLALATPLHGTPALTAGAAAYVLARLAQALHGEVVWVDTVLARAGFTAAAEPAGESPPTGDRAGSLALAASLGQQVAALLQATDSEFDRLPAAVRPLARGVFMSKVGYRSQDVLRAVHKLGDQLQRMLASHSGVDTEFQVDYPLIADIFERLITYYQAIPDETARLSTDQALLSQLRRQMAERETLIQDLLAALNRLHG
jgi:NAD(P)-dependent dehydrogenase (short-subunit alcohol dehydrogenase family)